MFAKAAITARLVEINLPGLAYLYTRTPFLFQVVDQICRAIYTNHPASVALPRPQYLYLRLLSASGPITQISLAQLGGIDTSTLSSVLGRLATKQYIERIRNPMNGREKLVAITPVGIDALTHAEPAFSLSG